MKSLHAQFDAFGGLTQTSGPTAAARHPESSDILRQCRLCLYELPTGRRLVDTLNLYRVAVRIEIGNPGYTVQNKISIVLTCPLENVSLDEMAIYLGCAIRKIELYLPNYITPEMKDSRDWQTPQLTEPFELMLVVCKLAHDMNEIGKTVKVKGFLAKNNFEKVFNAYEDKNSYTQIETLMFESFNTRN